MSPVERYDMKILAAGDSHTKFFGITPSVRVIYPLVRDLRVEVHPVNGATVAGVGRMNSTLQFKQSLENWLTKSTPDVCVLNLGQVDVELGTPYRRYVKGDTSNPMSFLNEVVSAYAVVISELVQSFPEVRFVVKGANVPVLIYDTRKSIADVANVVTERVSDVDVEGKQAILLDIRNNFESDVERHRLTLSFNELLESAVIKSGATYFDINSDVVGENGLTDPRFIPNAMDHHFVDSVEVRVIHWKNLMRVLGFDSK